MTTGSNSRSSRRPSRLFAADVAAAFAEATGAAEHTQEDIVWVALEIGEHLAELGRACEWHQIDGTVLGNFTLTGDLDDRVSFLRLAAPMLVWLGESGQLDAERVLVILESLADAVGECPRSRKVVRRQLDRLRATTVDESIATPIEVHDDAQSIAIDVQEDTIPDEAAAESLSALLPAVHLRCVDAGLGAHTKTTGAPDLPPEAA